MQNILVESKNEQFAVYSRVFYNILIRYTRCQVIYLHNKRPYPFLNITFVKNYCYNAWSMKISKINSVVGKLITATVLILSYQLR